VTELLHDGDRRDVERVARVALERTNATLAEHHVHVSAGQDVLGRQQPLLDGRRDAALQQYRRPRVPELPKEREVLHARADLRMCEH
jgi:hypothetical protein